MSSQCYSFEAITLATGMFDSCADAAYVLCMRNRYEEAKRKLREWKPSSRCFLLLNEGYARCGKNLQIENSLCDICDAYAAIFADAKSRALGNVLVLEDDFFFDPEDRERLPLMIGDVAAFLTKRPDFDCYNVGRAVYLGYPATFDLKHHRAVYMGTSHAVVYSRSFRDKYIDAYESDPLQICKAGFDFWWNKMCFKNYVYVTSFCYQLFLPTENRRQWGEFLQMAGIRALNLERQHQPGYVVLDALGLLSAPAALAVAFVLAVFIRKSLARVT